MPMPAAFVTTAQIYDRNQMLLAKAIDGIPAAQWTARPQESANSALWIVGHIVWARSRALKLLGVEWTTPWLQHFERGSNPADTAQYPSSDAVLAAWKELTATFAPALEAAPGAVIAAAAPQPSPSLDGTIGGMVTFLAMHESFHVGQVAYLRRLLALD